MREEHCDLPDQEPGQLLVPHARSQLEMWGACVLHNLLKPSPLGNLCYPYVIKEKAERTPHDAVRDKL